MAKMPTERMTITSFVLATNSSTPTQKAITNLCAATAPIRYQTSVGSDSSPTASPSKTAWNERASTAIKALKELNSECNLERLAVDDLFLVSCSLLLLGVSRSDEPELGSACEWSCDTPNKRWTSSSTRYTANKPEDCEAKMIGFRDLQFSYKCFKKITMAIWKNNYWPLPINGKYSLSFVIWCEYSHYLRGERFPAVEHCGLFLAVLHLQPAPRLILAAQASCG